MDKEIEEILIEFANDVVGLPDRAKFRLATPRKAIQALISKATRAARLDELKKLPIEYFCRMDEGRIKDRLKALSSSKVKE